MAQFNSKFAAYLHLIKKARPKINRTCSVLIERDGNKFVQCKKREKNKIH